MEEASSKRKSRDAKREICFEVGSSKGRLEIQDKPRIKKRVSNEVRYKFPKHRDDRSCNHKSMKERDTSSPNKKPTCAKCGKGV